MSETSKEDKDNFIEDIKSGQLFKEMKVIRSEEEKAKKQKSDTKEKK
ncbi:MAG: hypothetical protein H7A23_22440 [Leptospiraceae bacterium]|nr:hypothetical protein [Leptospiraceae bacterium]MCP5497322.1 hypothetical protein [Leptospiraceae bacterium]